MGILDNARSVVNRGTAAAERTTRSARLKLQLNDIAGKRKELAAQLGASLYEIVKDMPELASGRETLIDGISDLDHQRAAIEAELADIEAQAELAQASAMTYTCPRCKADVPATYMFCSGCGMPIADIKNAAEKPDAATQSTGIVCANCGAAMGEDDIFCMSCGTKREPQPDTTPALDENADIASE